jgi:putative two-component system response regulator
MSGKTGDPGFRFPPDDFATLESLEPVEDEPVRNPQPRNNAEAAAPAPAILEGELAASDPTSGAAATTGSFLRALAESNERVRVPIALLDPRLEFLHRNQPLRAIMRGYAYPERPSFLDAFARSLETSKAGDLKRALGDRKRGYSWRGEIEHWSRDAARVSTRIHFLPIFAPVPEPAAPAAFVAYFENVTEEKKRGLRDVLTALLKASLLKDNETGLHVERVNLYSRALAGRLFGDARFQRVDVEFIEEIGFLAAMHDVGKIGIRDDILNKEGPLTELEWDEMRQHTINGGILLQSLYPNPMAREIALSHHERWNGKGYPYNLFEKMIPLAARIVAIADVYDALRMRRSYKDPYPHARTVEIIHKDAGSHFDPDLVEVFLNMDDEFEAIFRDNTDGAT